MKELRLCPVNVKSKEADDLRNAYIRDKKYQEKQKQVKQPLQINANEKIIHW